MCEASQDRRRRATSAHRQLQAFTRGGMCGASRQHRAGGERSAMSVGFVTWAGCRRTLFIPSGWWSRTATTCGHLRPPMLTLLPRCDGFPGTLVVDLRRRMGLARCHHDQSARPGRSRSPRGRDRGARVLQLRASRRCRNGATWLHPHRSRRSSALTSSTRWTHWSRTGSQTPGRSSVGRATSAAISPGQTGSPCPSLADRSSHPRFPHGVGEGDGPGHRLQFGMRRLRYERACRQARDGRATCRIRDRRTCQDGRGEMEVRRD